MNLALQISIHLPAPEVELLEHGDQLHQLFLQLPLLSLDEHQLYLLRLSLSLPDLQVALVYDILILRLNHVEFDLGLQKTPLVLIDTELVLRLFPPLNQRELHQFIGVHLLEIFPKEIV